jgi:hypothetical protein
MPVKVGYFLKRIGRESDVAHASSPTKRSWSSFSPHMGKTSQDSNPGLFRFALSKLQIDPGDLVHVAQGTFSDLAVCTALGIRVIWVNRKGATLQRGLEPIAIIEDLSSLPAVLEAL